MTSQVEKPAYQPAEDQPQTSELIRFARRNALQLGIAAVLVVLIIFFMVAAPGTFLAANIYQAIAGTVPIFGIVALSLTMVIIAGEIDLSFPSIMAIGTVAFLEVYNRCIESLQLDPGLAVLLAFIACLASGFIAGLINGVIIVKIGIPSLIATIGTQFFWRGVVLVVREGSSSASLVEQKKSWLGQILVTKVEGWPVQIIWYILIALVVWLILNRHRFGAHVYLIGDNVDSARLMGINVDRVRMLLFAYVGLAAAFAGIIASLHVSNFFTTLGEGHLLTSLASVFLGGTSVFGGTGSVFGTFIATLIISFIRPGIVAIGWTGFLTELIYGLIITMSVAMHMILRRRMT